MITSGAAEKPFHRAAQFHYKKHKNRQILEADTTTVYNLAPASILPQTSLFLVCSRVCYYLIV